MNIEVPFQRHSPRIVSALPSKRPRNSRIVIRRVMKNIFVCALICTVGWWVVGKVARPIILLRDQLRESRRLSAELESLKAKNKELRRRLKYLKTSRGAADEARKLGYVKPGEVLLVLPPNFTPLDGNSSGGR